MDQHDDLMELVLAYSSKQVKYLATWIIGYNKADNRKERELRLEKLLYLNRFQRMVDEWETANPRERPARDGALFDYYATYIKPAIPNSQRKQLDELCYTSRWREAADLTASIDEDGEAVSYEKEYERLVTDSEYLIDQVVRIMRIEYAKRLDGTRKAMSEYIEPHRTALERLSSNIRQAREALAALRAGPLPQADLEAMAAEMESRIAAMEELRAREADNARQVRDFADEIQRASALFGRVIGLIELEKGRIAERRKFSGLVARLDIETPEMDALFHDMKEGLDAEVGQIRESFALLNGAFQDRIIDIISDQEKVNRVLESSGEPGGSADGETPNHDFYEEVLRILKTGGV